MLRLRRPLVFPNPPSAKIVERDRTQRRIQFVYGFPLDETESALILETLVLAASCSCGTRSLERSSRLEPDLEIARSLRACDARWRATPVRRAILLRRFVVIFSPVRQTRVRPIRRFGRWD